MDRRVRSPRWLVALAVLGAGTTALAQPNPARTRPPAVWAVVVGVENHRDPLIPAAKGAARDAGSVLGWLTGPAGWRRDHVLHLGDLGSNDPGTPASPRPLILPTRANLDWAFNNWLPARKVQPGDIIVVSFAGWMAPVSGPAAAGDPARFALLPADARRGSVAESGWALEQAIDRVVVATEGRCPVVCWLATAPVPATAAAPAPVAVTPAKPGDDPAHAWLGRVGRWPQVTAWLAATKPPANPAVQGPSTGFTQTLLRGMGSPDHRLNLLAALQSLQRDPKGKLQGFRSVGVVPPTLTLWSDPAAELASAPPPEMTLQLGHSEGITALASSADGGRIITASRDSTVRVWSPNDRALVRTLVGHEVGANDLALTPDGRWLVSVGGRPSSGVIVHDLADGPRRLPLVQPHAARVDRVVLLPDGDHFVTRDNEGRAFRWDLRGKPPKFEPWAPGVAHLDIATGGDRDRGVVATRDSDGAVRVRDGRGEGAEKALTWPDPPTHLAVAPTGARLAVGFATGRVVVRDLATGAEAATDAAPGPITGLALSARGDVAVGHAGGLTLVRDAAPTKLDAPPGSRPVFAPDGLTLAAWSGDCPGVHAWRLDEDGPPAPVVADPSAEVAALGFTGDGWSLIAGTPKGGLRTWPLDANAGPAGWEVPRSVAQVRAVAASPGRKRLLVIDGSNHAGLWDLAERSCRLLPGAWTSGVFLGDDALALTEPPRGDQPARVVRVALADGRVAIDPNHFAHGGESSWVGLIASADGTLVAATANPAQTPAVRVWEVSSGKVRGELTADQLDDPVTALAFSADNHWLATAGDAPEAKLWDLAGEGLKSPAAVFGDRMPDVRNVSAVVIGPEAKQVVTGHRDGSIRVWNRAEPARPPVSLATNEFPGAVRCLTFLADGPDTYLVAAGDGTRIWAGKRVGDRFAPVRPSPRPHHAEQIHALAIWPATIPNGHALLISGSADASVRLWEIRDQGLQLRGSLASVAATGMAGGPDVPADLDWVVHAPDGRFDASPGGRALVRFSRGERALPLEQFDGSSLYAFDLGADWMAGKPADATVDAALDAPPPIVVEPPRTADVATGRVKLAILLGSAQLNDIRLFHNGVALAVDPKAVGGTPPRVEVPVDLVKGENRFYAMAATTGATRTFETRSPDVAVRYAGNTAPGRLHVVALGVGAYERNRLQYANADANAISQILHDRGPKVGNKAGVRIVRTDADVTPAGVERAFTTLAREAAPQDTVVVFLAGHTGVFQQDKFCLLLPSFPFEKAAPLLAINRDAVEGYQADPKHLMPYATIETNLMRIPALNRLVIVDACQAEAIGSDTQVRQIRRWAEIGSRRARTTYLMAARRGEPALEADALRHGVYTYSLLRGMGGDAVGGAEPPEIAALRLPANADFDGDRDISTAELSQFARMAAPPIARLYPTLAARALAAAPAGPPAPPPAALEQNAQLQSANPSFPLVPVAK